METTLEAFKAILPVFKDINGELVFEVKDSIFIGLKLTKEAPQWLGKDGDYRKATRCNSKGVPTDVVDVFTFNGAVKFVDQYRDLLDAKVVAVFDKYRHCVTDSAPPKLNPREKFLKNIKAAFPDVKFNEDHDTLSLYAPDYDVGILVYSPVEYAQVVVYDLASMHKELPCGNLLVAFCDDDIFEFIAKLRDVFKPRPHAPGHVLYIAQIKGTDQYVLDCADGDYWRPGNVISGREVLCSDKINDVKLCRYLIDNMAPETYTREEAYYRDGALFANLTTLKHVFRAIVDMDDQRAAIRRTW